MFAIPTLALTLASNIAMATPICVNNTSELRQAINSLSSVALTANDFDVRIRDGRYSLTSPLQLRRHFTSAPGQSGAHRISGGWREGCETQWRNDEGTNRTVLDGAATTPILKILPYAVAQMPTDPSAVRQTLQIDRLSFENGANCLTVVPDGPTLTELTVLVDRSSFERCVRADGFEPVSLGTLYGAAVQNTTFVDNESLTVIIGITVDQGTPSFFNNTLRFNSVLGNANTSNIVRITSPNGGRVYNNIFADTVYPASENAARDVGFVGGVNFARNNRLQAGIAAFGTTAVIQSNNTIRDPGFDTGTSTTLSSDSQMRNAGYDEPPQGSTFGAFDRAGNTRIVDARIDVGAYELGSDRIFGDRFDYIAE